MSTEMSTELSHDARDLLLTLFFRKPQDPGWIAVINGRLLFAEGPDSRAEMQPLHTNKISPDSVKALLMRGFVTKTHRTLCGRSVPAEFYTLTDAGCAAAPGLNQQMAEEIKKERIALEEELARVKEQLKPLKDKKRQLIDKIKDGQRQCRHPGVEIQYGRDSEYFGPCPFCNFSSYISFESGPEDGYA